MDPGRWWVVGHWTFQSPQVITTLQEAQGAIVLNRRAGGERRLRWDELPTFFFFLRRAPPVEGKPKNGHKQQNSQGSKNGVEQLPTSGLCLRIVVALMASCLLILLTNMAFNISPLLLQHFRRCRGTKLDQWIIPGGSYGRGRARLFYSLAQDGCLCPTLFWKTLPETDISMYLLYRYTWMILFPTQIQ